MSEESPPGKGEGTVTSGGPGPAPRAPQKASIPMDRVNSLSIPITFVIFGLYVFSYSSAHGAFEFTYSWNSLAVAALSLVLFVVGILAHEGIHAAAFRLVGRVPWKDVTFGFNRRAVIPYTHCRAPVTARAFRVVVLLPGLLLGIAPGVIGVIRGEAWLTLWGAVFTAAAAGDFLVLWIIRSVPPSARVLDHPTEVGCLILPN